MTNGHFKKHAYKYKNRQNMYRNQIFLNETGCLLNEKIMPDITIMVPELEMFKKPISNQ
jgi:hypothetical protein